MKPRIRHDPAHMTDRSAMVHALFPFPRRGGLGREEEGNMGRDSYTRRKTLECGTSVPPSLVAEPPLLFL